MKRTEGLKQLDKKKRNRLRAILSNGDANTISHLQKLRGKLGKSQADALDLVLNSAAFTKALNTSAPFPKSPPFRDTLQAHREYPLVDLMQLIESDVSKHKDRLISTATSFVAIDSAYSKKDWKLSKDLIIQSIKSDGWSHAILRRVVLLRENLPEGQEDGELEALLDVAGLKEVTVASLIHAYSIDQNLLTIKKSVLNIPDRGAINRFTRAISRIAVQPFARSEKDLADFLLEVGKCSLVDLVILAKFNSHFFDIASYPSFEEVSKVLGPIWLFDDLIKTYDVEDAESEYSFFKQSSAWLEYEPVRSYRILVDNFYDASRDEIEEPHQKLLEILESWVGDTTLRELVGKSRFTNHQNTALAELEAEGTATRSAIFNYWLHRSGGAIGFEKDDLLKLMGMTRDLARTVPIKAARTAALLAQDELVQLILLLLLAKRSKNELDHFKLRKLIEQIAEHRHESSLLKLVKSYEQTHPYVSEYIYEIATEDFIAKLNKIAPHRADIPEVRASLHEWMAGFKNDDRYLARARAVRIDHQINRVRNEIDDHRIYVDPSRFSFWIEDEMMLDLTAALTSTGPSKKGAVVNCDETIVNHVVTRCYVAFCSNAVFGIESYIGRRIRHGTFHGHLYSSVINSLEKNIRFKSLLHSSQFSLRWEEWKGMYNTSIEHIIRNKLHVYSKTKPNALLHPENWSAGKQDVLNSAVKSISANFTETTSLAGIEQTIIDYCWRLAEIDLKSITNYLKAQQRQIKHSEFLRENVLSAAFASDTKVAEAFAGELEKTIDRQLMKMFGWFKRPSIVSPKARLSLLFDAIVAEVRDTIPDFNPQDADYSDDKEIELAGKVYHLVYDSLAVVVVNAAKHGNRFSPVRRNFRFESTKDKKLIIEITSSIKPGDNPTDVSNTIEARKNAEFLDANLYQGKSGISKLKLLAHKRNDFSLERYEVIGSEVKVRMSYVVEH